MNRTVAEVLLVLLMALRVAGARGGSGRRRPLHRAVSHLTRGVRDGCVFIGESLSTTARSNWRDSSDPPGLSDDPESGRSQRGIREKATTAQSC